MVNCINMRLSNEYDLICFSCIYNIWKLSFYPAQLNAWKYSRIPSEDSFDSYTKLLVTRLDLFVFTFWAIGCSTSVMEMQKQHS